MIRQTGPACGRAETGAGRRALVLAALVATLACGGTRAGMAPEPEAPITAVATVTPGWGSGSVWLVSTEPVSRDPLPAFRPLIDVEGQLTSVQVPPYLPPSDKNVVLFSAGATSSLTIRTDAGIEWTLGHHVEHGDPSTDATPDLSHLIGARVRLRVRSVDEIMPARGFVLTDAAGALLFAMDFMALRAEDVAGLTVQDGTAITAMNPTDNSNCLDRRHHFVTFTGDRAVNIAGGHQGTVTIRGAAYTAVALYNFKTPRAAACADTRGDARAWAIWQRR